MVASDENGGEEAPLEPMSPSAQFLKSSVMSLTILGVLESEVPIDDSHTMQLLRDVFLPINPRFSSIIVKDSKGKRKWKRVDVDLTQHVHVPTFPGEMSVDYYDRCFTEYLSNLGGQPLPDHRPLWEIHVVKYPTRSCAGNVVFKLHHSLGDGYSLMGALMSCLQRVDDPLMPLTFPTTRPQIGAGGGLKIFPRFFRGLANTGYEFGWGLLKSCC